MRTVAELTQTFVDLLCDTFPVTGTMLGRHEFDNRLGRYGADLYDEYAGDVAGLLAELHSYVDATIGGAADPGHELEAKALDGMLRTSLQELEEEQQWRRNPSQAIDNALMGCFALLLRPGPEPAKRDAALRARLRELPDYLAGARRTWEEVPELWARVAADSAAAGAAFLREEMEEALGGSRSRPGILRAGEGAARALTEVAAALRDDVDTVADGWAIGEHLVTERLRHEHHLPDTPSEMEARGLALVDETLAALADLDPDWRTTLAAAKDDHPSADGLVDEYHAEMERARDFVASTGLAPVTDAPLEVRPTPSFWVPLLPYAAYDPPGPFEPDQRGFFWVTVPEGEDAADRLRGHPRPGITVTAVHEGYPGHHLQLTHANAHAGLTRTVAESTLTIEGWAFYCEQLLWEEGYYGDDRLLRLYQLKDQLWRAARVVLDMRLHTGAIGVDAAIDYLVDVADLERGNATAEVHRYTSSPTYQICYAIGKAEILTLRDAVRQRAGAGFDVADFHRRLLDFGSVAVPLTAKAMLAP